MNKVGNQIQNSTETNDLKKTYVAFFKSKKIHHN